MWTQLAATHIENIWPLATILIATPLAIVALLAWGRRRCESGRTRGIEYTLDGDSVIFCFRRLRMLWACRRTLKLPLSAISHIQQNLKIADTGPDGARMPGTYVPGILVAGSFVQRKRSEFWYVADPRKAVVIDLTGHKYARAVVQVDEPEKFVRAVITQKELIE